MLRLSLAGSWLVLVLAATAAAQEEKPGPATEPDAVRHRAPSSAPSPGGTDQRLQRAAADLRAACERLLRDDTGFRGIALVPQGRTAAANAEQREVPFAGAHHGDQVVYTLGEYTVVTRGNRSVERHGDQAWSEPQGAAPDCPLTARALALQLTDATLDHWEAATYDDRPALLLHAIWLGEARKALIDKALRAPDARNERVITAIHHAGSRNDSPWNLVADAAIWLDPATRTLYAVTVRLTLEQREVPTTPAPHLPGLPPLAGTPVVEFDWQLVFEPADRTPLPELDAASRARLTPPDDEPGRSAR